MYTVLETYSEVEYQLSEYLQEAFSEKVDFQWVSSENFLLLQISCGAFNRWYRIYYDDSWYIDRYTKQEEIREDFSKSVFSIYAESFKLLASNLFSMVARDIAGYFASEVKWFKEINDA